MPLSRRSAAQRLGAAGLVAAGVAVGGGRRHGAAALHHDDATPETVAPFFTEYGEAWSSGDVERIVALYTDDVRFEQVPTGIVAEGASQLRLLVTAVLSNFSDLTITPAWGVEDGGGAAVEARFSTVYTGQAPGFPPGSGQTIDFPFVSVFELEGGRIARETGYFDLVGVLTQLGVMPPVGTPAA